MMPQSTLYEKLNELLTADAGSIDLLTGLFVPVTFRKGMSLPVHDYAFPILYFIEAGLVRGYFFYRQEEYTCWILEQGFLIRMARIADDKAAPEYIEFLTDTSGWSLNLGKAELLAQKDPLMYRILLEIFQENIREGKIRELMLRIPNAQDRYLFAKAENPHLGYKVIHAIYASFLNIESKYLFKIKKKLRL
jgi:CRP-like cAMP-binding protein